MALNEERRPIYSEKPKYVSATPSVDHRFEHLLKVADSIVNDANQTWAELWSEFRKYVDRNGKVSPEVQNFVPACGWNEFLEKVWLLKHYLDSIHRVCDGRDNKSV